MVLRSGGSSRRLNSLWKKICVIFYLKNNLFIEAGYTDNYLTIASPAEGLFRDRGSKFIAYAFPVRSAEDFEEKVLPIKKDHPKARHFCFAYVLGPNSDEFRYSDDGEPGGSAGLPIYNHLRSFDLHFTAVVVVRYFGGKKLGVPGLIHAYKTSTREALENASIIREYITLQFEIGYSFDQTGPVMRALNEIELQIEENGFRKNPFSRVRLRESLAVTLKNRLLSLLLKRDESDITGDEEIEGFYIKQL